MRNKIKIFVSHHKPWYIYEDDIFVPIQVGKKNAKVDLWILWDDTWDNISNKNYLYAELTAQYRVRKNYDKSNVDYVWFCHYRRYYTYYYKHKIRDIFHTNDADSFIWKILYILGSILFFWHTAIQRKFEDIDFRSNSKSISNFIKNHRRDVYLSKRVPMNGWWSGIYPLKHLWIKQDDFREICRDTLLKLYPEYKEALDKVQKKHLFNWCNMFIMKKELFIEYSQWLFNYLSVLENNVKEYNINLLQECKDMRFYGYLSERLLNLFLEYKKLDDNVSISYWANVIFLWI